MADSGNGSPPDRHAQIEKVAENAWLKMFARGAMVLCVATIPMGFWSMHSLVGGLIERLDAMGKSVAELAKLNAALQATLVANFQRVDEKLAGHEKRIDGQERRLERMEFRP